MSPSRRTAALLAGAFALAVAALYAVPKPAPPVYRAALAPLPQTIGQDFAATGSATDETTDAVRQMLTPGTRIATRTYRAKTGAAVQVIRIVGTDRNALHDPRSCLAGVGWSIENDRTETENRTPVRLCRLVATDNRRSLLVAYAYQDEAGRVFADPSAVRARLLYQAFVGGVARPLTFVRLITPDDAAQSEAARQRLRRLAADLLRVSAPATPVP